jgi:DNA polymerase III subunit epsilon
MREIVLDTETTGISPADGHRVVEIGAVELFNHVYINPERDMPADAAAIHGLTSDFLKDKPVFAKIAKEFLDFIADAGLVIHNAAFDVSFLNAELSYLNLAPIEFGRVVDTLQIARRKHPMASNSLDALCRRYGVDNSKRTRHGALLDSELLAEVYLELIGGRQQALDLASEASRQARSIVMKAGPAMTRQRPKKLESRLSEAERSAHAALVQSLGPQGLWPKSD